MSSMSRRDIDTLVGEVDELIIQEMIGTGASRAELAEALSRLEAGAVAPQQGRPSSRRRIRRLLDLLMVVDQSAGERRERLRPALRRA
ncbi:hypothetical protein ACFQU1_02520 [Chelatococcus sp. GCM10030263]|uniref:hypothetical protein n=1 Tax=Chelatococcus sp. GCM10030263 TaxID=3273387 RepID=UPI0036066620